MRKFSIVTLTQAVVLSVAVVIAYPQESNFKQFRQTTDDLPSKVSSGGVRGVDQRQQIIVKRIAEFAIRKQDRKSNNVNCARIVRRVIDFEESSSDAAESNTHRRFNMRLKVCRGNCIEPTVVDEPQCVACWIDVALTGIPESVNSTDDLIVVDRDENEQDDDDTCDFGKIAKARKLRADFSDFVRHYNKTYAGRGDAEEKRRLNIFRESMKRAEYLQKTEKGTAVYGVTPFSDLTEDEFRAWYTGGKISRSSSSYSSYDDDGRRSSSTDNITKTDNIPTQLDWRESGVVSPVKNQGSACGSCWSFVTTGILESQYAIHHSQLIQLSEQELIDCDTYDHGCDGGIMQNAYRAIKEIGGLERETDYPYKAARQTCSIDRSKIVTTVSEYKSIDSDENTMAQYVASSGPIGSTVFSGPLQHYKGGIMYQDASTCDPQKPDHAILIVGYGVQNDPQTGQVPYWIVKNSWGIEWGENGYIRLYRGANVCGIKSYPSIAYVN